MLYHLICGSFAGIKKHRIMKITGLQAIYHNFVPRPPGIERQGESRKGVSASGPRQEMSQSSIPSVSQKTPTIGNYGILFVFAISVCSKVEKGESENSISMNTLMIFPREWRDSLRSFSVCVLPSPLLIRKSHLNGTWYRLGNFMMEHLISWKMRCLNWRASLLSAA